MADDEDTGAPARAQFRPQEPIMGALVETARGWVAFTSGKPMADWSGRDTSETQLQIPNNPSQWRHAKDDGYKYRCDPLDANTKFARNGDFAQFGERLFKCFQARGQETVTYVPLPSDNTVMESVLLNFVRFNKTSVKESMATLLPLYDEYDKGNDAACIQCLLSSLDVKLKDELMAETTLDDSFCEIWIELNQIVRSTSVTRFATLRNNIRDRDPAKFGPQNIVDMANAQLSDARELQKARQYDPNPTTLHLIDSFLKSDGSPTFSYEMQSLRSSIRSAIQDIQSMTDTEDKNLHMKHEALDFETICRRVKDLYRDELDNGRWSPVKNYKDTRGAPRNFGAHHASAEAFILEQRNVPPSTTGRQGGCHLCGSLSHWCNACPHAATANNASRILSHASSPSGRSGRHLGNRNSPSHSGRVGRGGRTSSQNRSRNVIEFLP
ncbi:hypothetical protein ACA910_021854 [Epithemia clementina (nom. ined.)]